MLIITANQIEQNLFMLVDLKVLQERYVEIFEIFFFFHFIAVRNLKFCPNSEKHKNFDFDKAL